MSQFTKNGSYWDSSVLQTQLVFICNYANISLHNSTDQEKSNLFLLENHFNSNSCFNSFPNEKSLHKSKLKGFADDKINVTQ